MQLLNKKYFVLFWVLWVYGFSRTVTTGYQLFGGNWIRVFFSDLEVVEKTTVVLSSTVFNPREEETSFATFCKISLSNCKDGELGAIS